jgi:uncharacterized protein YjdB
MKTIILTTNQSIEVVLQSAKVTADCDVVAAWADNGTVFAEGESHIKTDGTTAVVAVPGPDEGVRRIIKSLNFFNADSVAVTATIRINSNGVYVIIASVTLSVRDTWTLEGCFDKYGSFKGIGTPGNNGKTPYELAVAHGYAGTEIQWLDSLHGITPQKGVDYDDGTDGREIQMAVVSGYLCQRYVGDTDWIQLYKIPNAETQPTWISAEYRDIEAGTADSHVLLLKALYAFTITSCVLKLDDGTLEISFLKNGTEITGISAISATTNTIETPATGNNKVAVGDELSISWGTVYTGNPSAIIVQLNIDTAPAEQIPVTTISITGDSTGVAGNTIQLTALITPSNATNKTVVWTSSDTSKATVNSSGLVTLIAEGPVTITATASDGSAATGTKSLTITASNIAVSSISILGDSVGVQGNTIQLSAAVLPANATNKAVTWTSSDTSKATVSSTGLVTLIAAGSVTITATASDGSEVIGIKQLTIEAAIITPTVSNLSFTRTSDSAFNVAATIDTKNQDALISLEYGLTEDYGSIKDITGAITVNGNAVSISTTLEF